MTKNEDILKPFDVIERQILEVEKVVEKNKYFTILFFSQLYTQLDTCQKVHPPSISSLEAIQTDRQTGRQTDRQTDRQT